MHKLEGLAKYLPENCLDIYNSMIVNYNLRIIIKNPRRTKHGDFKPSLNKGPHQITINGSLNKYHFLITLIHETAHLYIWEKYQNRVLPHGTEWQKVFFELMQHFLKAAIFPEDVQARLFKHLSAGAKASSSTDVALLRTLQKYDEIKPLVVEDIPVGACFQLDDGRVFKKGQKQRSRYLCTCLDNKRQYLFSPLFQINEQTTDAM